MKSSLLIGFFLISSAVCVVSFFPKHETHHDIPQSVPACNVELEKPSIKEASTPTKPLKEAPVTVQSSDNISPTGLSKPEEQALVTKNLGVFSSNVLASDHFVAGKKERTSQLTLKDEIYMDEYSAAKFSSPLPSPEKLKDLPLGVRWGVKFSNSLCGRPLIQNGQLVFATYDTQIFKLNGENGEVVQKSRLWYQPVGSPEWHKNRNIIFPQRNGNMTSVDFNTWERRWNSRSAVFTEPQKFDLSISGISVNGDDLYVAKFWGSIYVNDARNGAMLATPGVPYESRITTPVLHWKGKLWFSNVAGEVMSVRRTGTEVDWKLTLPSGYALSLKPAGDLLICTTSDKEVIAIDPLKNKILWTLNTSHFCFNAIEVVDEKIIVAAGELFAVNFQGQELWRVKSKENMGFGRSLAVTSNAIFAAELEGRVLSLSAKGEIRQEWDLSQQGLFRNGLAIDENAVYASSTTGVLLALDRQK